MMNPKNWTPKDLYEVLAKNVPFDADEAMAVVSNVEKAISAKVTFGGTPLTAKDVALMTATSGAAVAMGFGVNLMPEEGSS